MGLISDCVSQLGLRGVQGVTKGRYAAAMARLPVALAFTRRTTVEYILRVCLAKNRSRRWLACSPTRALLMRLPPGFSRRRGWSSGGCVCRDHRMQKCHAPGFWPLLVAGAARHFQNAVHHPRHHGARRRHRGPAAVCLAAAERIDCHPARSCVAHHGGAQRPEAKPVRGVVHPLDGGQTSAAKDILIESGANILRTL